MVCEFNVLLDFLKLSLSLSQCLICTGSIDSVLQPLSSDQSIVLKMALTRCSIYGDHLSACSSMTGPDTQHRQKKK